jgi:hypothetical protein
MTSLSLFLLLAAVIPMLGSDQVRGTVAAADNGVWSNERVIAAGLLL